MVAGTSRMSSVTIKRQPINQQKRKSTRADPTQTRVLLKNYDVEARPSAEQFADMSQETNLCAVLITFATFSDTSSPVEWIKKWFLRKRKADGKNRTFAPSEPAFAENDPSAHDGQALGHTHSKFWSVDAFVAADSTSFSPSVGHIPKLYGHRRPSLPPGNPDDYATDSRGNEEEAAIPSPGTPAGTGYGYVPPSNPILACENVETATPTSYNLQDVLFGADAFAGYVSLPANEDAPGSPSFVHPNIILMVDDPGSTLLLSAAPSLERSIYPDNPYDEGCSGSESFNNLEFSLENYSVASMSSPLDTIDDFIPISGDLNFIATASYNVSDDLEFGAFDSTIGCLDLELGSSPGVANVSDYMTSILGESSVFYESLLLQTTEQDPTGDSINLTDCSSLLGIDVCLGAGMPTGHEVESTSALGLSLVNFDDDWCDPAASMTDFGGFDVRGNGDDVEEVAEGVDSDEMCWANMFDTMF
ncbi:hypothetical protein BDM02DRAFT_3184375 [Thelephora ganbajun]|uniref:Uncharacterized protein n=1 Tax=Thelephora ganbajun TaxID=370292 RepID=A0ACB6ZQC2_THEGA|nr:hypothetical protein BDM02DRAFT_3184375 [Thelephora ganbajun]